MAKQNWDVGQTVRVGFLQLEVVAKIATPGDGLPDAYILARGAKAYEFIPHNGLTQVQPEYARRVIAENAARVKRIADKAIADAKRSAREAA